MGTFSSLGIRSAGVAGRAGPPEGTGGELPSRVGSSEPGGAGGGAKPQRVASLDDIKLGDCLFADKAKRPRALELFSGSFSVGKVQRRLMLVRLMQLKRHGNRSCRKI